MNLNIKYLKSCNNCLLKVRGEHLLRLSLVLLLIHFTVLQTAAQGDKPSRQVAEAAWNKGDYETAYQNYNGLLLLYSRDPSYGYYTGACLVNLQRDIQRAVTLLGSASHSSQSVKTIPDEIWFYYGRALQLSGNFNQATDAFGKYSKVAGKKKALEMNVPVFMDECAARKGAIGSITAESTKDIVQVKEPVVQTSNKEVTAGDNSEKADKQQSVPVVKVSKAYDKKLTQAVKYQYMSDSLLRIAEGIRRQIPTAPKESIGLMKSRVAELENQAGHYLTTADSIFMVLEPGSVKKMTDTAANELYADISADENIAQKPVEETIASKEITVKLPEKEKTGVFSFFEIKGSPVYSASNPIPVGKSMPKGLIYHIQLAAFKNPVSPLYFRNLYPVFGMLNGSNGVTYYYTGMFRTHDAAAAGLPAVRSNGFADAFIVAFVDNSQVSMEKAAQLESVWAGQPLFYEDIQAPQKSSADSIPSGTLTFRAEVLRSVKAVKPEAMDKIELLAGNKGMDITKNIKGETIILIGNFITFESADEYVSLLIRNGYSTARVVAYVGNKEIPVESAKGLFNKLLNE